MSADGRPTSELGATLGDFTSVELIVPQLQERDKPGAIKELSYLLQKTGCIPDMLLFYNEVLNREFLVNTALDCGMAFPHARMNDAKRLSLALGRSADPIPWGPRSVLPVRLVFLLAVPTSEAAAYLYLLSGVAKIARECDWFDRLYRAETAPAIWHVLKQIQLRPRQSRPVAAS